MVPPATLAVTMRDLDALAAVLLVVGAFLVLLSLYWFGQVLAELAGRFYVWLRWGRRG